ncbi:hypothetical protein [Halomonas sp. GFAJ-1]|uniref:hypothetical protein n=1 Tax=Halomonas sp. GFAJ-1 TaxID=1118153 RepID=UPI00023A37F9|nr:hypothetical protein [Halomonas sp. GFAJ-1]AVI63487.1 hypothetical protein BB497_12640 [Halomonas sp. GFAJ-1]EHK62659.1 hypothetical protein MOY_00195 [Halomonas sp. GFAJ-1]
MDRIYAWDDREERVVYRISGHIFDDGREDSDVSPVWIPANEADLPDEINVEDLQKVTVKK